MVYISPMKIYLLVLLLKDWANIWGPIPTQTFLLLMVELVINMKIYAVPSP
jgi:hypothetical protein